ncbi:helix-turn-helix domain-containing protein [Chryseobacterium sp. SSA4.19]|uniref:helix-turn-helix domain-containing protein n=1 Tax=Chryseobacterium sp. SSA4.19 TaxID=2919915 RepID=UPI001F4ED35B|nr:helix-turn-helix transcriptional regulator [Chryseobacterium sp. SSA4.19]MCJ8154043.1 helix-turn-helix domain-containing protein [Chryseobacterium sp. SSA4.19]
MDLNERIAKVIEYSRLTSSEFADEIDVQRSSISHITSGRNKPSLEFIIKIKSRFPEILWDWLVTGQGEMLKSELSEIVKPINESVEILEEKTKPTSLPDLFTMINKDEDFSAEEDEIQPSKINLRESSVSDIIPTEEKITDSQRLEENIDKKLIQSLGSQKGNVKRIVIFYDNGKFESFEP